MEKAQTTGATLTERPVVRHGHRTLRVMVLTAMVLMPVRFAWSDIYTYVDERGVRHFTNVPHLSQVKYRVYIKEPASMFQDPSSKTRFDPLITEASKAYGVSESLIKAIIKAESNFNPRAVSRKGAKGLMQLMPGNIRDFRVRDPFDPRENIMGGTRYFKRLINRFGGELSLSIAAYNAGPEKVDRYRRIPPYKETRDYVKRVLKYYRVYRNG